MFEHKKSAWKSHFRNLHALFLHKLITHFTIANIIILYNERTIIFRIKYEENENGQSGWYVNFTDDFDGFVAIPCGEDTLPIFITSVLIYSSFERISSMDIPELINPIIDDALHRGESYKQCIYKKK